MVFIKNFRNVTFYILFTLNKKIRIRNGLKISPFSKIKKSEDNKMQQTKIALIIRTNNFVPFFFFYQIFFWYN